MNFAFMGIDPNTSGIFRWKLSTDTILGFERLLGACTRLCSRMTCKKRIKLSHKLLLQNKKLQVDVFCFEIELTHHSCRVIECGGPVTFNTPRARGFNTPSRNVKTE